MEHDAIINFANLFMDKVKKKINKPPNHKIQRSPEVLPSFI